MSFFNLPELEVSPEKADEMIEKIASYIVSKKLETPAIFALQTFKPVSYVGSQFGLFLLSPFLSLIPENWGYSLIGLLQEHENVEKLIQRIEELSREAEAKERSEENTRKSKGKRTHRTLLKLFQR